MFSKNRSKALYLITLVFSAVFYSNTGYSQEIEAIGQCTGVTTDETYTIFIDSLTAGATFTIEVDNVPVVNNAQDSFRTPPIAFIDGTVTKEVLVINNTTSDTTTIDVHEVLCIDIDGDGELDFNTTGCDYTEPVGMNGSIISTVAPHNTTNVYLYVLVPGDSIYTTATSESNNKGLFEDLENGDYRVFAYNFLSKSESDAFLTAIPEGTNLGSYSAAAPACFMLCGSAPYTIDCESIVDIYTDPADVYVCSDGEANFYIQDSFLIEPPAGATLTYAWEVNSGAGYGPAGSTDSTLDLSNVMFADSGNMYRVIVTMTVAGTTISMDTSGIATLHIYDSPVMASGLDVTVNSDMATMITLDVSSTSIEADSFEIVSIDPGGLTPDPGNASEGITTDTNYIYDDMYTNTTGMADTATYEVVAISGNGCRGDTIEILVIVRPCPEVSDLADITVCSDDMVGVTLPGSDDNGLSIDSFAITANTGGLSGDATADTTISGTSLSALAGDMFSNSSDAQDSVVYSIVAYANDCASPEFTVTVYVDPEPVYEDVMATVCSDEAIGESLAFQDDSGLNVTSVSITAVVGDSLSGTASTGSDVTATNFIENDIFTNTSSVTDSVVYTITPTSGDCEGDAYTITVKITPEPVGSDPMESVCSDETLSIDLASLIENGATGVSFQWYAEETTSVTGATDSMNIASSNTIDDQLTNTSSASETVTYKVIPTGATCVGDTFTVSVTVIPELVSGDHEVEVCSGEAISVNLADSLENASLGVAGFNYTVTSSSPIDVPAESGVTDTSATMITDTYTNTTSGDVIITYTVTPISTSGCEGDPFSVDVTVVPEPEIDSTLMAKVCSDSPIGITLGVLSTSVAADSFSIVNINSNGLVASAGNPTASIVVTETSEISDDAWTNETSDTVNVVYQVAAYNNGCLGETFDIVATIDPAAVVEAGDEETVCSTQSITLGDLGASIMGGATDGTWSSSTGGSFDGGTTFSSATTYTPSTAEKDAGFVTLTLTSDDPDGECGTSSDTVTITILDIRCSDFPWNGNDDD